MLMMTKSRYDGDDDRITIMVMMTGSRHDVDDGWITIS